MTDTMIENSLLKVRILQYQKEYLRKKGVKEPTTEIKLKMRKAVSYRLRDDLQRISAIHKRATNTIYDAPIPELSWR